jgi:hypothetical protein
MIRDKLYEKILIKAIYIDKSEIIATKKIYYTIIKNILKILKLILKIIMNRLKKLELILKIIINTR